MEKLLEVQNLKVYFKSENTIVKAVDDISYDIYKGETLGIVGESGSGKSVSSMSILKLNPEPPAFMPSGKILFKGKDILKMGPEEIRKNRGNKISIIFQEPMTSLHLVLKIKTQMVETLLAHNPKMGKSEALERSIEMLNRVGIPDAKNRINNYPYQYSGGMKQRVMIAMSLLNHPELLIADEPTTALDVTIQAQILDLMIELRGNDSILLVTHDLAVVAEVCDRVIVMYGGKIQEVADVNAIFEKPLHPYSIGLQKSIPIFGKKIKKLEAIKGIIPSMADMPKGCKFCTRCPFAKDICFEKEPDLVDIEDNRKLRCHKYHDYVYKGGK